ncbi:MAG: TA system VapC family ribonuclease toxin [Acidobacteriota bacterium]
MLVDANLLLYAVDARSQHHPTASAWLQSIMNGERRVGLPWLSLSAFVRVITNPRASERPLTGTEAWAYVRGWLECDVTWIPNPTDHHAKILGSLIARYDLRANMIVDAQLAALALEHGLTIYSADTDFARFSEVAWVNPLAGA